MAKVVPAVSNVVTSTGTITLTRQRLGGFDLNCDGTNEGTLIIRDTDSSGKVLVNTGSVVGKTMIAPIPCSGTVYYSVSGTGADAMIYEWLD